MIELHNISKYYGKKAAVRDLSLHIKEGETLGLIGTSGCGKTTTLKMINRLVEPSSGSVVLDGQNTGSQPVEDVRRQMGYVIQNVGLFPHYTVAQNIAIVPQLLDWPESDIQSRSNELLELVGLDPENFAARMPASLSGGQQQRIGLARALAADPPIILMDEPFGALDPITKREVRQELDRIFKEINKTIVLVTHDVQEAFEMCDRLCLLDNGAMQQVGAPKELLFSPANEFTASFFDANRLQLEMQSITVADILEIRQQNIHHEERSNALRSFSAGEGDVHTVKLESSFFQAFELSRGDDILIMGDKNQPIASLSADELLEGFHAVRQSLKEGSHD